MFFLGGFFSVAADAADPGAVNWALAHVRQASIARHAAGGATPREVPAGLIPADLMSPS